MTVRQAMPLFWKYVGVVLFSCSLAFLISTTARADAELAAPNGAKPAVAAASTPAGTSTSTTNFAPGVHVGANSGTTSGASPGANPSANPGADAGPYVVAMQEATWTDAKRKRDVPVRIYSPSPTAKRAQSDAGKFPVIVFSHGLGGNRAGGKLWGEHWASHGFISIHIQHAGSDESIWRNKQAAEAEGSLKGAMTITNLGLRVGDVHFVLDEIARQTEAKQDVFAQADSTKIGMCGHSFGAQTTLALSGQRNSSVGGLAALDKRITASIAFSPNARNKNAMERQFSEIRLPFFSITGTLDGAVLNDGTKASDRELPHQHMAPGNKYLLVLDGGDHMVFGGHTLGGRRPTTPRDVEIQADVKAATLAFWKAFLQSDASAKAWLDANAPTEKSVRSVLATNDRFEMR
jgi:predicted dienelactone hydrolase